MKTAKSPHVQPSASRSACPISAALEILGDKWSLLIIRDLLFAGRKQFREFLSASEGISTNILSQRLKDLEAGGIVEKRPYQDSPIRYDYILTRKGQELRPLLLEMISWGSKHIEGTYSPTKEDLAGTANASRVRVNTQETDMSERKYPNESEEYREARESLLSDEKELVEKVKSLAEKRRDLPLGGKLKEDYVFQWANDGKVGKNVKFSELFGDKNTLLLYSFMYGPGWDNPCPSCTSLVDGFDRSAYQVSQNAAFVAIAKAPADRINAWAKKRAWSQINLVSGAASPYQADYQCQGDSDDMQWPVMHVFRRQDGDIYHFWGTELQGNHVDTVWPYWNLMDFTPEGRPDILTPPQNFRSEFLEKNFLNK